jgi:mono/diheme cytochrome c family protein
MRCHGADGARGLLGARNLRRSVLTDSAIKHQILTGKGFMPSFRKKLREPELEALVVYVKGLRAE